MTSTGHFRDLKLEDSSEALPMDNRWAGLVVLLLGDPHLLEGAQGRQDGTTDPHRVLALRGRHNFDLHCGRRQRSQLLCHALTNALEHSGTSRKNDIGIQVLADVHITLHDGLECSVVDTTGLLSNEAWLEQHLWAAEALVADSNDVSIRQLIGLLLVRALTCSLHLAVEVNRNVAELLLHITHDLTLRRGCE